MPPPGVPARAGRRGARPAPAILCRSRSRPFDIGRKNRVVRWPPADELGRATTIGGSTITRYRILALSESVAREVRATGRSPRYGHPAPADVATGYGPCRLCLQFFRKGEERRILFTYDAFHEQESLPLPGPVYIHESPCERYPEHGGFPAHLGRHRLTLHAYARGRLLRAEEHVDDGVVEPVLERLLEREDVDYVHVRDTSAGCYDLRVDRA